MPDTFRCRLATRAASCVAIAGTGTFLAAAVVPSAAWAWDHAGHVGISELAILSLPAEVPAHAAGR